MDLNTLSRRELQALCKSNGIPANKTNVFMVDALTKKRIPLSKMDANRDQKPVNSIASPPFKSPPLLARKARDVDSTGPTQQKPPLFQNNFLRRGKRKDAPASHESDQEGKPKVQNVSDSHAGLCKSSSDLSQQPPAAGATQVKNMKTKTAAAQAHPNQKVSTKAKVDSSLSGLNSENLSGTATRESKMESRLKSGTRSGTAIKVAKVITSSATCSDDLTSDSSINGAKEKIEDRVRSQIDAALCSKVMKAPEAWPSAPPSLESSERALEFNVKEDKENEDRSEYFNCSLAPPEQQNDNLQVKLANSEVFRLLVEYPEQQMESLSFPPPLACETATKEETALTSTPPINALQRSDSLDVIAASPPITFSPIVRLEEKVRSIAERVANFWKGSRNLTVVNSFGSPVQ